MSMDEAGRLYVATGNSTPLGGSTPGSMGERVIRLGGGATGPTGSTATASYFEATDARMLDLQDLDIGSVAPLVLPPIAGAPRMVWQGGKAGVSYLFNRDEPRRSGRSALPGEVLLWRQLRRGGDVVQRHADLRVRAGSRHSRRVLGQRRRHGPSGQRIGAGDRLVQRLGLQPLPPAVSSNGNNNGVLWVAGSSPATLRAVDIATGMEIFADAPPSVRQWTPVVVADGRVYVTGARTVSLYTTR
jgi:hypothetical protein